MRNIIAWDADGHPIYVGDFVQICGKSGDIVLDNHQFKVKGVASREIRQAFMEVENDATSTLLMLDETHAAVSTSVRVVWSCPDEELPKPDSGTWLEIYRATGWLPLI